MRPAVGVPPRGVFVLAGDDVDGRLRHLRLPLRRLLGYAAGAQPAGVHGAADRRVSDRGSVREAEPASDAREHGGVHEERHHTARSRGVVLHVGFFCFFFAPFISDGCFQAKT